MNFDFQPTLFALPQLAAVVLSLSCIGYLWLRRRDLPGIRELIAVQFLSLVWCLMGALEFCAVDLSAKILFSQLSYIGVTGTPWALLRFAQVHTRMQTPMPRWFGPAALVCAALILLAVFTNARTGLVWPDVTTFQLQGETFARYHRGPVFWLTIAYGYGLTLWACLLFLRHAIDLGGASRGQMLVVLVAVFCPFLSSFCYILRIGPCLQLDNTPVGFALGNAIFTWHLIRWRMFDIKPVATRILFERMPEPVLVIDTSRRLTQANSAAFKILRFRRTDVGAEVSQALCRHPAILAAILADRPAGAVTDENGHWWDIDVTPLHTPKGRSYGRLCVLHNISALVKARREAERAHHAKSEFLAQVSHDLRTPVHSIIMISEMLLATGLTEEQRLRLANLRETGGSLLRLVNDLLDMNRIEAGRLDLQQLCFRLDAVLQPVAEVLRLAARLKGLELLIDAPDKIRELSLYGDPDRLRQILFNLIGNAVKFTDSGHVAVRASLPRPGVLCIEVIDTGPGIPAAVRTTLFEPFVRGPAGRGREGSGLGLSIVRRLAEAMGGGVAADNGPAGGSVFTIELPIVCDPRQTPRDDAAFPSLDRLHGLIVDDESATLETVSSLVERHGGTVDIAESGEEAVAAALSRAYDFIVMDRQMPGVDGVEATRRIREPRPGHPNQSTPIIGLTTDIPPVLRAAWLAAGVSVILLKPLSIEALLAVLRERAARKRDGA